MIVEYRLKENSMDIWAPIRPMPFDDLNMEFYSIRINKDRQYHRIDTSGFKEAYNKAISWMKLTGKYDEEWDPW